MGEIVEKARRLRAKIETLAETMDDEMGLDFPDLFPMWITEKSYVVGERTRYNDVLYKCVQAHTSQADWTPDVVPALWTVVSVEDYPEWVQPTGAQDAYMTGDKVSYDSKHWVSTVDNNVWAPGVYGWEEE